ncbi:hypothetical protein ES703_45931 [subsurface metagenome]
MRHRRKKRKGKKEGDWEYNIDWFQFCHQRFQSLFSSGVRAAIIKDYAVFQTGSPAIFLKRDDGGAGIFILTLLYLTLLYGRVRFLKRSLTNVLISLASKKKEVRKLNEDLSDLCPWRRYCKVKVCPILNGHLVMSPAQKKAERVCKLSSIEKDRVRQMFAKSKREIVLTISKRKRESALYRFGIGDYCA